MMYLNPLPDMNMECFAKKIVLQPLGFVLLLCLLSRRLFFLKQFRNRLIFCGQLRTLHIPP